MSNPSNLYAEKVFSEHPVSMWALDDPVDYISLISEPDRDLTIWTITSGSATSGVISNEPFIDSFTTLITGDVPATSSGSTICISPDIINFTELDQDLKTFCVGGYFYSDSPFLKSISIGFEYTDTETSNIVKQVKTFITSIFNQWTFISSSFEIPNQNTDLRIVLEINYNKIGAPTEQDYLFYINGITLGQWSEEFCSKSLGITPINLPSDIPLTTNRCTPADNYGLGGSLGYYLIQDNTLKARNTSIPMVYGASNTTVLRPNGEEPSLIVPGDGFLNKLGQYKDYTVEFWMRINSDSSIPKKIFGPIASQDGLYVDGPFLTLLIGDGFQSHFVGEWFRPMLIDIILVSNSASVLINGEEVISLSINTSNLDLPNITDGLDNNQDWLGFYCYDDVSQIDIDCVAIYSYAVPPIVAKRRWVYGQGVASPESINSAFNGTQALIDYTFADYTANYNYPDFANWSQGTFDNLVTTENSLQTPAYSLPQINIIGKTLDDLYTDNLEVQDPLDYSFITFRPNTSWNLIQSSFNIPELSIVTEGVYSIYGVFSSDDLASEEILFKIYNESTGNYFIIKKNADEIRYYLVYNGIEEEVFTTDVIVEDEKYAVGVNIPVIANYFGGDVLSFFTNQNGLKIYVAGDENDGSQFTGKVYSFALSTEYNTEKIKDYFEENGTVILDSHLSTGSEESQVAIALIEHTGSYTVLPTNLYEKFFLDIGVAGYWEDYLPLSYFAQFVKDQEGQTYYDIDFLQFNINYPRPYGFIQEQETSTWTYEDLINEYSSPLQKTYSELDNSALTQWDDYQEMQIKTINYDFYNTGDALVKSYVTFQYVKEGANAPESYFTNSEQPLKSGIIDISEYPNWRSTRFEVVDDFLIYPSKKLNFSDLAIVYSLEFNNRAVLTKPINIRRLELASQVFNSNSFNPINTRFGIQIFPYTRSGLYFDYKKKNPYTIYKGSTPYLYLNRTSGIEIRGEFDSLINRGIAIPINRTLSSDYSISAMQMWARYDLDKFPSVETEIFEIDSLSSSVKFFMVATDDSGQRARIFALDSATGVPYSNVLYYLNNSLVSDPILTVGEWASFGISFGSPLAFDSYLGSLNLTGPLVYNNVSYYQPSTIEQSQGTQTRPWLGVKTDGVTDYEWNYWKNSFIWQTVLNVESTNNYGVNPSEIYNIYIGTNKIIVDDNEGLEILPDTLSVYSEVTWSLNVATPV
jgi:hypothetical protein